MPEKAALPDRAALRDIGWTLWNPIGLEGPPATPADEYDGYLLTAAGMLARGEAVRSAADYLVSVVTREMRLTSPDRVAADVTAAAIQNLINRLR